MFLILITVIAAFYIGPIAALAWYILFRIASYIFVVSIVRFFEYLQERREEINERKEEKQRKIAERSKEEVEALEKKQLLRSFYILFTLGLIGLFVGLTV